MAIGYDSNNVKKRLSDKIKEIGNTLINNSDDIVSRIPLETMTGLTFYIRIEDPFSPPEIDISASYKCIADYPINQNESGGEG